MVLVKTSDYMLAMYMSNDRKVPLWRSLQWDIVSFTLDPCRQDSDTNCREEPPPTVTEFPASDYGNGQIIRNDWSTVRVFVGEEGLMVCQKGEGTKILLVSFIYSTGPY